jgi:hypothetical protein
MTDLFGAEVIEDHTAAAGFAEFWKAWPSGSRKVAKPQCLKKWEKYACSGQRAHILAHVEHMKSNADWLKDQGAYIPQPLTYLNQQRWIDWAPEPVREKKPDALQVIKEHKGAPIPQSVRDQLASLRRRPAIEYKSA